MGLFNLEKKRVERDKGCPYPSLQLPGRRVDPGGDGVLLPGNK